MDLLLQSKQELESLNEQLRIENADTKKRVEDLTNSVNDLSKEKEETAAFLDDQRKEMDLLLQGKQELESLNEQLRIENADTKKRVEDLTNSVNDLSKEKEETAAFLDDQRKEMDFLLQGKQELEFLNEQLRIENADTKKRVEDLTNSVNDLSKEKEETAAFLDDQRKEMDLLLQSKQELESLNEQLRIENADTRERVEDLTNSVNDLSKEKEETAAVLDDQRKEMDLLLQSKQELESLNEQLRIENADTKKRIEDLTNSVNDLSKEKEETAGFLDDQRKELDLLLQSKQELESLNEQLRIENADTKKRVEDLTNSVNDLSKKKEETATFLDDQRKEMNLLRLSKQELESLNEQLRIENQDTRQRVEELTKSFNYLNKEKEEASATVIDQKKDVDVLLQSKQELESLNEQLRNENADAKKRAEDLTNSLSVLSKVKEETCAALIDQRKEMDLFVERKHELESLNEQLRIENGGATKRFEDLTNSFSELSKEKEVAAVLLTEHRSQTDYLQQRVEELESVVDRLKYEQEDASKAVEDLIRGKEEVVNALNEERDKGTFLLQSKEELECLHEVLKCENSNLISRVEELSDNLNISENDRKELTEKVDNYKMLSQDLEKELLTQRSLLESNDSSSSQDKMMAEKTIADLEDRNVVLTNSLSDMERAMEEIITKAGRMEHDMKNSLHEKEKLEEGLRQAETRRLEIEQALEDFVKMTESRKKRSDRVLTEEIENLQTSTQEVTSGYATPSPKQHSPTSFPFSPSHSFWGSSENITGGFFEGKTFGEIFQLVEEERCSLERKLDNSIREQNDLVQQLEQAESLLHLEREKLKQVKEQYSQLQQFHDQKQREHNDLRESFAQEIEELRLYAANLEGEKAKLEGVVAELESISQQIRESLKEKEEERVADKSTISGLQSELHDLILSKEDVEKVAKETEDNAAKLEAEVASLTEQLTSHAQEISEVKDELKIKEEELQKSVAKQEQDMTKAKKVMKKMKTSISEKEKEAESLKRELEESKRLREKKEKAIEMLERQASDLQIGIDNISNDLRECQVLIEQKNEEILQLNQGHSAYQEQQEVLITALQNEKDDLSTEISKLQAVVDDGHQEKETMEKALTELRNNFAEEQSKYDSRLKELEVILTSKDQDVDHLVTLKEQQLSDITMHKEKLERTIEEKDLEIDALKEGLSGAANDIQKLITDRNELESSLNDKNRDFSVIQDNLSTVTIQFEELERIHHDTKISLDSVEKDLLSSKERESLSATELMNERKERDENEATIKRLQNEIQQLQEASMLYKEQLDLATETTIRYKDDLDTSMQKEERFAEVVKSMEEDLNFKESELNSLKNDMSALSEENQSAIQGHDLLSKQLLERDEVIQSLKEINAKYQKDEEDRAASLTGAEEKMSAVMSQLESTQNNLEAANGKITDLTNRLVSREDEVESLNTSLRGKEEEAGVLNESYQALSWKLSELTEELENRKKRIEVKEQELVSKNEILLSLENESGTEIGTLRKNLASVEEEKESEIKMREDMIGQLKLDLKETLDKLDGESNEIARLKELLCQNESESLLQAENISKYEETIRVSQEKEMSALAEKEAFTETAQTMEKRIRELERMVEDTTMSLNEKENCNKSLEDDIQKKNHGIREMEAEILTQKEKISSLEEALHNMETETSRSSSDGQHQNAMLLGENEAALEAAASELQELRSEKSRLSNVNENLLVELDELKKERSHLLEGVEDHDSSMSDVKVALDFELQHKQEIREKLTAEKDELAQQILQLSSTIERLSEQLNIQTNELQNMAEKSSAFAGEKTALQGELASKEEELETVKKALNGFKVKMKRKLRTVSEELTAEKDIVANKINQEEILSTRISELENELSVLQGDFSEIEMEKNSLRNSLTESADVLEAKDATISQLHNEIKQLQDSFSSKHDSIKAELEEKDNKLLLLQNELIGQDEALSKFSDDKEALISSLESKVREMEASQNEVHHEKETIQSERENLLTQLGEANALVRELSLNKEEVDDVKKSLAEMTISCNDLQQEKEELKNKLAKVVKKAQAMKKELSVKDKTIDSLKKGEKRDSDERMLSAMHHPEMIQPLVEVELYAARSPTSDESLTPTSTTCPESGVFDNSQEVAPIESKNIDNLERTIKEQAAELAEKEKSIIELEHTLEELRNQQIKLADDSQNSSLPLSDTSAENVGSVKEKQKDELEVMKKKYDRQADNLEKLRKRMTLMRKAESKLGKENKELESSISALKHTNEELVLINKNLREEVDTYQKQEHHLTNQNLELRKLIDTFENDREVLDKELKGITCEIQEVKSIKEDLLLELDSYKERLNTLDADYSKEKRISTQLTLEREKLMDAFMDLGEERNALKSRVEEKEAELHSLEDSFTKMHDELNQIREEVRNKDEILENFEKQLGDLRTAKGSVDEEYDRTCAELQTLKDDNKSLNDQLSARQKDVGRLSEELTKLMNKEEMRANEADDLLAKLNQAETIIESMRTEREGLLEQLQRESTSQPLHDENNVTRPQELQSQGVVPASGEVASHEASADNSLLDVSGSKETTADVETVESVRQHKDLVIGKLKLKLKQTIKGNKSVKENLESKIEVLQREVEELTKAVNVNKEQIAVETCDATCETESNGFEELELLRENLADIVDKYENLKAVLDHTNAEKMATDQRAQELSITVSNLESLVASNNDEFARQSDNFSNEVATLQSYVQEQETQIDTMKTIIEKHEVEMSEKESNIAAYEAEINPLRNSLQEIEEKLNSRDTEIERNLGVIRDLTSEMENLRNEAISLSVDLQREKTEREAMRHDLTSKITNKEEESSQLEASVARLEEALRRSKEEFAPMKEELESLHSQYDELCSVKQTLERELLQARAEMENSRTEDPSNSSKVQDGDLDNSAIDKEGIEVVQEEIVEKVQVVETQTASVEPELQEDETVDEVNQLRCDLEAIKKQKDTTIAKLKLKLRQIIKERDALKHDFEKEKNRNEEQLLELETNNKEIAQVTENYELIKQKCCDAEARIVEQNGQHDQTLTTLNNLKEQLSIKDQESAFSQSRIKELENAVKETERCNKKLQEEKISLEELKSVLEETIEVNEKHVSTLQASVKDLHNSAESVKLELSNERRNREKAESTLRECEDELQLLRHSSGSLQRDQGSHENETALLRQSIESFEKEKEQSECEIEVLRQSLELKDTEKNEKEAELQLMRNAIKSFEKEKLATDNELQGLNEALQSSQKEKEEAENEVEVIRHTLESLQMKDEQNTSELLAARESLELMEVEKQRNQNELDALRSSIELMQKKNKEIDNKLETAEGKLVINTNQEKSEIEAKASEIAVVDVNSEAEEKLGFDGPHSKVNNLVEPIEEPQATFSTMKTLLSSIASAYGISDYEKLAEAVIVAHRKQESFDGKIEQVCAELAVAKEKEESTKSKFKRLEEAAKEQMAAYRQQIKEMGITMVETEEFLGSVESELVDTRKSLLTKENEFVQYQESVKGQEKRLNSLLKEIQVKEDDLKEIRVQRDYERHRNQLMREEIESLKTVAMPEMRSAISEKNKSFLELRDEFEAIMSDKEAILESLKEKNKKLLIEKEALERSISELQTMKSTEKEDTPEKQDSQKQVEEELIAVGEVVTDLTAENEASEDTFAEEEALNASVSDKTLSQSNAESRENVALLKKQCALLQKELETLTKNSQNSKDVQVRDFEDISYGLRGDIELALKDRREMEVSFELDRLNLEHQREEKNKEIKLLKSHLSKKETEVKQKNLVISELQDRLEDVSSIAAKENHYLSLEERLNAAIKERDGLITRLKSMEESLEEKHDANNQIKQRLESLTAEKDSLVLDFESKLQKNLDEHTAYCQRLKDEFEVANREKEATVHGLQEKIEELEDAVVKLESLRKEEQNRDKEAFEQRLNSLKETNTKLEKERLLFRQDLIKEMETSHQDVALQMREEYQQIISEKDEKIDEVYEQFSDTQQYLYTAQDENVELREEISALRLEMKNALLMIDAVNREKEGMILGHTEEIGNIVKAKGKEFKQLREQFEETMMSKDEIIEQERIHLKDARDKNAELESQCSDLQVQNDLLRTHVDALETEVKGLSSTAVNCNKKIEALIEEIRLKDENISELCIRGEECEKEAAFFKKQLQEKYAEIDDLRKQLIDKEQELESKQNTLEELKERNTGIVANENNFEDDSIVASSVDKSSTPETGASDGGVLKGPEMLSALDAEDGHPEASSTIVAIDIPEVKEEPMAQEIAVPSLESTWPEITDSPTLAEDKATPSSTPVQLIKEILFKLTKTDLTPVDSSDLKHIMGHLSSLLDSDMYPSESPGNEKPSEEPNADATVGSSEAYDVKMRRELDTSIRTEYDDILKNLREDIQSAITENQALQAELFATKQSNLQHAASQYTTKEMQTDIEFAPLLPSPSFYDAEVQTDVDIQHDTFTDLSHPKDVPWTNDLIPEARLKKSSGYLPEVVADTLQGQGIRDAIQAENADEIRTNDNDTSGQRQDVLNTLENENTVLRQKLEDQNKTLQKLKQISKHYKAETINLKTLKHQELEALKTSTISFEQKMELSKSENIKKDQELQNLREEISVLVEEKKDLVAVHKNDIIQIKEDLARERSRATETLQMKLLEDQKIIQDLEDTNIGLNSTIEDLTSTISTLEEQAYEIEKQRDSFKLSANERQKSVEELNKMLDTANVSLKEKVMILQMLTNELDALREANLPKAVRDTEVDNACFDSEDIKSLQGALSERTSRVYELEKKFILVMDEHRQEEANHELEIKTYQEAVVSLKDSLQRVNQEKVQIEKAMQELRDDMEGLYNDRDNVAAVLKERLHQLRHEKEDDWSQLESEFRTLLSQRENDLWESKVQIENLTSEQFGLKGELSLVKEQLNSLQEQNMKLHEINANAMAELQKTITDKKAMEGMIEKSEESILAMNVKAELDAKAYLQHVEVIQQEKKSLQEDLDKIRKQLDTKANEYQKLGMDNQRKRESIRKLKKEVLSLRHEKQQLEDDISSECAAYVTQVQRENEGLRTSYIEKNKKLQECRMHLEQSLAEKSYLQETIKSSGKVEFENLSTSAPHIVESAKTDDLSAGYDVQTFESRQVVNTPEEERLRFQLSKLQSEAKSNESILEDSVTKLRNELTEAFEAKGRAELETAHLRGLLKNHTQPKPTENVAVDVVRLKDSVTNVKSDLAMLRNDATVLCQGFQEALQETRNAAIMLLQKPQDLSLDITDYRPVDSVPDLSFMEETATPPSPQQQIAELEQTLEMWKNRCSELEEQAERRSHQEWGRNLGGEDSFLIDLDDLDRAQPEIERSGPKSYYQRLKDYGVTGLRQSARSRISSLLSGRRGTRTFPPLRRSAAMIYVVLLHAMALWAIYCAFRV